MKLLLFLLLQLNINFAANKGQFEAGTYVGGQFIPVTYSYSIEKEPIFTSKDYFILKAKVLAILGPNKIRALVNNKQKSLSLIGLMDFLKGLNDDKREFVTKQMQELIGKEVFAYLPKEYEEQGLTKEHAYIMNKENLVNFDLISKGYGILDESQNFFGPLKESFSEAMQKAAANNLGIFGLKK